MDQRSFLRVLYTVIFYHCGSYEKKKSVITKTAPTPENNHSFLDIMTGSYSSNDMLMLRQNVEINSILRNFGNEIVDHVEWKRHCAITKKMSFNSGIFQTLPRKCPSIQGYIKYH